MIKWRTDEPPRATEVLVTWENVYPAPYYDFIRGKRFVDEAVWGGSHWYWFDCRIVDNLAEYGELESLNYGRLDRAIKVIAWSEMPEPYGGEMEWSESLNR
jgi:hypothetical protein